MKTRLRPIWTYIFVFTAGFILALNIPTLAEIQTPNGTAIEKDSPSNWVTEDQIKVTSEKIEINVKNAKWAKFTNTNSMDPVLDQGANAIQIKPTKKEQLSVGDIITYNINNQKIIHRIIKINNDGEWYCITKGDNNNQPDPNKIRFNQIEKVLIGIIY